MSLAPDVIVERAARRGGFDSALSIWPDVGAGLSTLLVSLPIRQSGTPWLVLAIAALSGVLATVAWITVIGRVGRKPLVGQPLGLSARQLTRLRIVALRSIALLLGIAAVGIATAALAPEIVLSVLAAQLGIAASSCSRAAYLVYLDHRGRFRSASSVHM